MTSAPIDLKQFGLEQNPSASPITGNEEDYNKYFQTTKTTYTKTTGPADLKQFGIDMNSASAAGGLDLKSLGQNEGKTTTTTTITKTENVGENSPLGYNTYVGPKQSYSYNYSYKIPSTGTTTVTKTTYSGVLPGKKV